MTNVVQMSRLEEGRRRSELETAVAALESANKTLESALATEQKECAAAQKKCDAMEKKAADLSVLVAELKSDLNGTQRLLTMCEKELKVAREEKAASETRFSAAISDMRATAEAMKPNKPSKAYNLKITGRDGNNDMSALKIEAEE